MKKLLTILEKKQLQYSHHIDLIKKNYFKDKKGVSLKCLGSLL